MKNKISTGAHPAIILKFGDWYIAEDIIEPQHVISNSFNVAL